MSGANIVDIAIGVIIADAFLKLVRAVLHVIAKRNRRFHDFIVDELAKPSLAEEARARSGANGHSTGDPRTDWTGRMGS